jgi:hypothetical protein
VIAGISAVLAARVVTVIAIAPSKDEGRGLLRALVIIATLPARR